MTAPVPPRSGLRRSRSGAVLGGVCAGVAGSAGLDPLLFRIAVVAVTLLTGGAALVAYLVAWVLIPREAPPAVTAAVNPTTDPATTPTAATPPVDLRAAWSVAGKELRSLAGELRKPSAAPPPTPTTPARPAPTPGSDDPADPPAGAVPAPRSPLEAADDVATALGDRLRAPEVQKGARRAATSVSQALAASVDEVGRRVRRDRT